MGKRREGGSEMRLRSRRGGRRGQWEALHRPRQPLLGDPTFHPMRTLDPLSNSGSTTLLGPSVSDRAWWGSLFVVLVDDIGSA